MTDIMIGAMYENIELANKALEDGMLGAVNKFVGNLTTTAQTITNMVKARRTRYVCGKYEAIAKEYQDVLSNFQILPGGIVRYNGKDYTNEEAVKNLIRNHIELIHELEQNCDFDEAVALHKTYESELQKYLTAFAAYKN